MSTVLSIGFDDTDSPKGMCTTYLGFRLAGILRREGVEFLDYPRLVRLNPNIPWKTRGNGAVGLKIMTSNPQKIKSKVIDLISKNSETENGANPAVVFYEGEQISEPIRDFSRLAMWKLIRRSFVKKFVKQNNLESFYLGNGQGLVGAVGVLGYEFGDATLELLSYRKKSKFGIPRRISQESVKRMQERTFPHTFNSYDEKRNRQMIAPRGPDPVLYGIRGDDPLWLLKASKMIQSERPDGYMLYKSNQGTADHLRNKLDVLDLKAYTSGTITGMICQKPVVRCGGHASFAVRTGDARVQCMAYKESGLAGHVLELDKGDRVMVGGGVRRASGSFSRALNVEFVDVQELEQKFRMENPTCKDCNKRMKSRGKNQGFGCVKCKNRSGRKLPRPRARKIRETLYLPVPSSQRHLTRPHQRQGMANRAEFDSSVPWFRVFGN